MRRILTILSFFLLTAVCSQAQSSRTSPAIATVDKIKLYPNPAQTYITFDLQSGFQKGMSIQIYHMLGKKMYEAQNVGEKTTINLGEYNRGVYIYHLTDQSGKLIESGKFQVSK